MARESCRQLVPLLLQGVLVQSSETKPIPEFTKLKTAKLADKMGIMVTALYDKLVGRGYLELRNGKRTLTDKGREIGGEVEPGKESSFLWPPDLIV
jgi:hypothetical protein